MVTVRTRGTLPHWEGTGATYFVTFRLADSLPKKTAGAFEAESRDIVQTAQAMRRKLSATEKAKLARLFSEKYERYLDGGSGSCILAKPEVAAIVAETLKHFHEIRYLLFAWCVMPNHVHVVFRPTGEWSLDRIVHTWKSYSVHATNRLLKRSGTFWQREYYDHLIRSDVDLYRCVNYVLRNPEKAGLRSWSWLGSTISS
jgi:REP element-mobilizing transposase RayT